MCGIAGSFALDPRRRVDPECARRMAGALAHRGPDADGFFHDGPRALGFRRLAILDLSAAGNQPHRCERGGVYAVVNGEIYNHRELRAGLEARGHVFRSNGDAEVIPHLYVQHGDDFVERLHGMFALAVVDTKNHRLLLARDRLGKKPLYVAVTPGCVDFASEAQALVAAGVVGVDPDPAELVRYLAFGYVPAPGSAFRGLARLEPGGRLVADQDGVKRSRWWEPPEPAAPRSDAAHVAALRGDDAHVAALRGDDAHVAALRGDDAWKGAVLELLVEATRDRLASDVPLGVFLSGGIDSGLVLAAARRATKAPLRAFTIGFADPRFDETNLAQRTAARYGAELVRLQARPRPERAVAEVAAVYDEPFGDSSAIPTLLVSQLAKQHVTVVLSGDGGDETFAGYRRHQALLLADGASRFLPAPLARAFARALGETANGTGGRGRLGEARRFAAALGLPPAERSLYWSTFFRAPLRARFLHPDLLAAAGSVDPEGEALRLLAQPARASPLRRVLRYDLRRYLPDDLLVKVDMASMSCALEVRCPLLDHRLVELSAGLPDRLLNDRRHTKVLLRSLAQDLLPPEVAAAKKRGFGVPLADWLRGPLRPAIDEMLLGERFAARRVLRDGAAAEIAARHAGGREDWSSFLWLLLALEGWFRRFVDRDAAP